MDIALQNPLTHPLHFVGLELTVSAAFALTLAHALRQRRRGDGWPLMQWLTGFFYGVIIELVAYNFWDNYDHGQFTVQLYHHKLPLYVTLLYPAFHYTGLKLVESWRLGRVAEALVVGLCIMLIDVPFDTTGPGAGWWRWSTKDPNMAVRWLGVPITSYYWYLLFGAIYAALLRALQPRLQRLVSGSSLGSAAAYLTLSPLVGTAVLMLGIVAFIPFHLIKAAGVPPSAIVAAHIVAVGVLAWRMRPVQAPAPGEVRAAALVLLSYPALVLVTLPPADWPAKTAVVTAALVAMLRILRSSTPYSAAASTAPGVDSSEAPPAGTLHHRDT